MRWSASPIAVWMCASAALALACGSGASRPAGGPLLPVVRFVDEVARRSDGQLEWAGSTTIAGETRPVLSAGRSIRTILHWNEQVPEAGSRTYRVGIPVALRQAPFAFAELVVQLGGHHGRQAARLLRPRETPAPLELTARFEGLEPGASTRVLAQTHGAPPLAARDVVTDPVAVARGASLRFGLGVQEVAWRAQSPGLEFVVDALAEEGAPAPLFRRRMDPAQIPDDRGWHDARLELGELAGRTVRFRFRVRAAEPGATGTSLPVWSDPVLLAPRPESAPQSVLLVSLDTLRARSTSAYGLERRTTPRLEALAEEGALFENAIAPVPHTLPSHMSIFTGLHPRAHGVRGIGALDPRRRTLTQALREAGYATAAFTEDGFLRAKAGFRRGFSRYYENKSPNVHQPVGQIGDTFARGKAWLREYGDQPFFLFLHTYQVHDPYVPPDSHRGLFGEADALGGAARHRLLYEQEIRYADEQVGALLDELEELGLARSTLVIVTSDHGEEFMEHGRRRHGFHLYEESIRVPLILRWPGEVAPGLRVAAPVSLVDLPATILDLLGLPPIPGAQGGSLAPLLRDPAREPERPIVFAETAASVRFAPDTLTAARTDTAKCILRSLESAWECYDLRRDPSERRALQPGDLGSEGERLRAAIEAFRAAEPAPLPEVAPPDPATLEKLRALGYTE